MKRLLILALVLLAPAAALADPTNIIVIYDGDTMNVAEVIVPDSDAEAAKYFSGKRHPEFANEQRALVPYADAKAMGILPAIAKDAPALNAMNPASVTLPLDQVLGQSLVQGSAIAAEAPQ